MEGKFVYVDAHTEKCQIPAQTLRAMSGWTGSKISKVTDGSGRENISPKLAESKEDVGRFGHSQHD